MEHDINAAGLRLRSESGQAMVEFALVIPVFLLVLFLIIDVCWIAFQKSCFEQSCRSVELSADMQAFCDSDSLADVPSENRLSAEKSASAISQCFSQSSFPGFFYSNFFVSSAQAVLYNTRSAVSVPGRTSGSSTDSVVITRYVKIDADICYVIHPLTYVGRLLFSRDIENLRHISFTHPVAVSRRSQ